MGFLDLFRTKEPNFRVTQNFTWDDYTPLIRSDKYLDQYFGWVFIGAKTMADSLSMHMPRLFVQKGEEAVEVEKEGNELLTDLYKFNPYANIVEGRKLVYLHKFLTGMAFLYPDPIKERFRKFDFYALDPTKMSIIYNEYGLPKGYKHNMNGEITNFEKDDLVIYRETNPQNWLKGFSLVDAVLYPQSTYEAGTKYNYNFLMNNARPQGLMFLEGATENQAKILEKKLKAKYQGPEKAGKIGVINTKVDFIDMTKSNKDLELSVGMQNMRDEILQQMAIGLKELIVGGSTYSNMGEAQRTFQEYALKPHLILEEHILNEQLIPMYYGEDSKYFFKFDDPVTKDEEKDARVTGQLYKDGLITLNEAREKLGYDSTENGDDFHTYSAFGSLNQQENPEDTTEDTQEDKPEDKPEEPPKEEKKSVKKKISKETREELRIKLLMETLSNEQRFLVKLNKYLHDQNIRVLNEYQKRKKLSLKVPNLNVAQEDALAVETFIPIYDILGNRYNEITSDVLMEFGIDSDGTISDSGRIQLRQSLDKFGKEINSTTRDQINRVVTDGITNGSTIDEVKLKIIRLYDDIIYGQSNIDVLTASDSYVDRISLGVDGDVVVGSNNRWNRMLENVTRLPREMQSTNLQALANIVDESDPVGQTVSNTIKSLYGVDKQDSINTSRAETIARTETNKIKSIVENDRYEKDPVVKGKEWLSAQDSYVRDTHRIDGEQRRFDQTFSNGLKFPSDPNGPASEVINCRCDIIPVVI